jgi:hypothetical protein
MGYYEEKMPTHAGIAGVGTLEPRNRELIPNLRAQRDELVQRIQRIDTLLGLLEKNPDFVKMLDLTRELV